MPRERKHATTTPEQIKALISTGMSAEQAAQELGVSLSGLRQACSLFGWRWKGFTPTAHRPFGLGDFRC